jgi:phage terminase large subunit
VKRVQPWMSELHAEACSQVEMQAVRELVEELERETKRTPDNMVETALAPR